MYKTSSYGIERGERQPQDAQQANMFPHPAALRIAYDRRSGDFLPASTAEALTHL